MRDFCEKKCKSQIEIIEKYMTLNQKNIIMITKKKKRKKKKKGGSESTKAIDSSRTKAIDSTHYIPQILKCRNIKENEEQSNIKK